MYQILIKVEKTSENDEQIASIRNECENICSTVGEISISNDSFECFGYTSETDDSNKFSSVDGVTEVVVSEITT